MAKRKRPQAKRQDQTRRIPGECLPTSIGDKKAAWRELKEGVEEAARQGRRLRSKLYYLYRKLFPWFREGVIAEKYGPLCETKPESVQRLYERADNRWTAVSALRPLRSLDDWETAAFAAGVSSGELNDGETWTAFLASITNDALTRRIFAWACALVANQPGSDPVRYLEAPAQPAEEVGSEMPADAGPDSVSGFLGGKELADALGVHAARRDAFAKKLGRIRPGLGADAMIEQANRRPNDPQYLYKASDRTVRETAVDYQQPKRKRK